MAHQAQQDFCNSIRQLFPDHFRAKTVLDVGSLDINGNNRYLFADCDYLGIDIGPGPNVDLVCPVHLYPGEEQFDTIISTEALEHDEYWQDSLRACVRLLKPGGLFLFTCATTGRKEHGTRRTTPGDAPHCGDYYKNLTVEDIWQAIPSLPRQRPESGLHFERHEFEVNDRTHDLYFWGIKRNDNAWGRQIGELDAASEAWLRGETE
jgi:SAM-dependent methyltransferase